MGKVDRYSRKIANYIYNDMDVSECEAFEKDLLDDEDLALEYKIQSAAVNYLKAKTVLEDMQTSSDLKEAERIVDDFFNKKEEQSQQSDNPTSRRASSISRFTKIKRVILSVAATAAVLTGIIIIRSVSNANLSDRLFDKFYEPLDYTGYTVRGVNDMAYAGFIEAYNLYEKKDYVTSSRVFSSLISEDPDIPESHLYLALSKIGESRYSEAAALLQSYLDTYSKFQPEAKWYLAMCYMKMNRISDARDLFLDLTDIGGKYGVVSRNISGKLSRLID